jgi:hypothetical protein
LPRKTLLKPSETGSAEPKLSSKVSSEDGIPRICAACNVHLRTTHTAWGSDDYTCAKCHTLYVGPGVITLGATQAKEYYYAEHSMLSQASLIAKALGG